MFAVRGSAGVQRALQPDAAHARAHGRAALRLQGVRERLPPGEHAVPAQDHPHAGEPRRHHVFCIYVGVKKMKYIYIYNIIFEGFKIGYIRL